MEMNKKCTLKLISGEPNIGKLVADEIFEVQFVVPGQNEDMIDVSLGLNSMLVKQDEDGPYSKAFIVLFVSDFIDFRRALYSRSNGVVAISCEIKEDYDPELMAFKI